MNTSSPERWAIIGGGMLGLTLAKRLVRSGKHITILEASNTLGGLASAWTLDDVVWDRHYHVTLLSDIRLRCLLSELGLEEEMKWVSSKTGVYADGTLYSVSNALEFLQFPPLKLLDKLRLGGTIIYGSRIKDWETLENIGVEPWLRRWSGDRTFEKFWLPLLRAKLGENYRKASAAFIWAIIARLYAARRSGLKEELFGYLPGGYARLFARFQTALEDDGVDIQLGQPVKAIKTTESAGLSVHLSSGDTSHFDQVVVTTAAPMAARLCPEISQEERDRLHNIQYQGIICASLLLKKPLSPYYVTNITDTWVPFTGVIEMTTLVDPDEFGGRTLVYLPKYVDPSDSAFDLSDQELEDQFVSALETMYPDFNRSDVLTFQVSRVKHVLAISTLGYSQSLPPMQTSVPGLHIINSAHILNGTLNVNETVQLAEQAALTLRSDPRGGSPQPPTRAKAGVGVYYL